MRKLTYRDSIREAIRQSMKIDESVFVYGQGVDDAQGVFGTSLDLVKEFGNDRVFDVPVSENALTGIGVGASLLGMRPIMVNQRIDFTLLAMDQIANHAAKLHYMWGGHVKVPFVIRNIVGRGWGQGSQHTQCFHSIFSHFPGLKVIVPSNAYDAKGLLIEAIRDNNPVITVEHKFLLDSEDVVPEEMYNIPFGRGRVVKEGTDVTVVAFSQMVIETIKAVEKLAEMGIDIEIIDPRTAYPLDEDLIGNSVKKTGRLVIADIDWINCGITAEVSARISENYFTFLKAPIKRIGLPHANHPSSYALEEIFFPDEDDIVETVKIIMKSTN